MLCRNLTVHYTAEVAISVLCPMFALQIIPADLNAWLYQMENNIAWMANQTGDAAISDRFNRAAAARKQGIEALLWDNAAGETGRFHRCCALCCIQPSVGLWVYSTLGNTAGEYASSTHHSPSCLPRLSKPLGVLVYI